ncbi:RNA-splicing ligase RtcB, partial [bacterium]|nr:RNA-splicing ligase RtcB [bacterium]
MSEKWKGPLEKVDDFRWRIPADYARGMRVPGLIYADAAMIEAVRNDQAPQQVVHVAHLPGILGASMAMPDI